MMSDPIELNWTGQPGGSLPERRDATENRARILKVAEQLFAERGVPTVSMADIAQAANVGKGTLYRNFSNKGELCLALMDTQLREFQDRQLALLREQTAEDLPHLEQLARFLEALVRFSRTHMPLLIEVQQASDILSPRETNRPHFWQYMTVRGLLRNAARAGETPPELDSSAMAEALLAPLAPYSFRFQNEVLGFGEERIVGGMRLILNGLGCLSRE